MPLSVEEAVSSPAFKTQGFVNVIGTKIDDELRLRVNLFEREDFEKWKVIFSELTCSSLNCEKLLPAGKGRKVVFGQRLICQHGRRHKGIKKTYTG